MQSPLAGGVCSQHRECIAHNGLDHEAVRCRGQSIAEPKLHIKNVELEIGDRGQRMLLVGQLAEVKQFIVEPISCGLPFGRPIIGLFLPF
jgi:hypothetical protein